MDLGFGEALLIFGALLAVAAALSGLMRGTVLSASVLSVALGIVLARARRGRGRRRRRRAFELIELALILTLISDGLLVDRELLGRHWGPPARALVFAMPITLVPAGARRQAAVPRARLGRGVPARRGALRRPTRSSPRRGHRAAGARADPPHAQPRVRAQRRARAAVRALLPRPRDARAATPGRRRPSWSARPASAPWSGSRSGSLGGWLHRVVPGGVTARYEGIYAVGFGLAAFGLADVTFGNGLIAAFVSGITLGFSEHEITERFADFSENVSAIFQVLTFFVFGAIIVATGYDGSVAGAARLHRLRAAGRAAGRGDARARRHRAAAAAEGVHRLVRPQGRRLDAVRAAGPRRSRSRNGRWSSTSPPS